MGRSLVDLECAVDEDGRSLEEHVPPVARLEGGKVQLAVQTLDDRLLPPEWTRDRRGEGFPEVWPALRRSAYTALMRKRDAYSHSHLEVISTLRKELWWLWVLREGGFASQLLPWPARYLPRVQEDNIAVTIGLVYGVLHTQELAPFGTAITALPAFLLNVALVLTAYTAVGLMLSGPALAAKAVRRSPGFTYQLLGVYLWGMIWCLSGGLLATGETSFGAGFLAFCICTAWQTLFHPLRMFALSLVASIALEPPDDPGESRGV